MVIAVDPPNLPNHYRVPLAPWSRRCAACHAGIRTGILRRTPARTPAWQPGYPLGLVAPRMQHKDGSGVRYPVLEQLAI